MNKERELKSCLTRQQFDCPDDAGTALADAMARARGFALATEGIAVVSDFQKGECHIYSGKSGQALTGLPEYHLDCNSAFEDILFSRAEQEGLVGRHVLELRFFGYVKNLPAEEKANYAASCVLCFNAGAGKVRMLHTTRYLGFGANGSVSLGLCTYVPCPSAFESYGGVILNMVTGEAVGRESYEASDRKILSRRQLEILSLLAKGVPSKQIADLLNISVHTVNRHRQDILSALKVANSAAAVDIALRMNLI